MVVAKRTVGVNARMSLSNNLAFFLVYFLFVSSNYASAQICGSAQTTGYSIPYQSPADCQETNNYATFFNATQLQCCQCSQNSTIQKTSVDGLRCECQTGFFLTYNHGGFITCAPCPTGWVTAFNRWECVQCTNVTDGTSPPECPSCTVQSARQITVQSQLDGSYSTAGPSQTCEACASFTSPNHEGRQCTRCNQILSVVNSSDCLCNSINQVGGLCFRDQNDIKQPSTIVNYGSQQSVNSAYFVANAAAAVSMCSTPYSNTTACEQLANLCTLSAYDVSITTTVCSYYRLYADGQQWPQNLPWLFYLDTNDKVLLDAGIPTQFSFPNGELRFLAGTYALNGTFLGYQNVTDGLLQLCTNSDSFLNAAYAFGTRYSQKCQISAQTFWDQTKYTPVLYDLWLEYDTDSGKMLYAVPVYFGTGTVDPSSTSQILYRRFFLVDNIIGIESSAVPSSGGVATHVRYAKDMTIYVNLQDNQNSGLIYPPYLVINYGILSQVNDYTSNTVNQVTFQVVYSMSISELQSGTSIAIGVLTGLSLLYAFFKTWSWSRRSGRVAVDFLTLIKFLLFSCGYVANSLFIVAFGAAIFWWILYKNQNTVVLVIPSSANTEFIVFLAVGFALKLLDLAHVIIVQSTIRIFLVDWERPESHGKSGAAAPVPPSGGGEDRGGRGRHRRAGKDGAVSIWRTYFVANEFNELQTFRKIDPVFQIFASVFFLSVVGFGNLATEDPHQNFQLDDPNNYYGPMNAIFRFGLIGMVYLVVAVAQWLFFTLIYERFFEHHLLQYVDFCSMNNISIFIFENDHFGYYIHGRSVHGRSDVGLREMHENFTREERNLCSERGLEPSNDHQTFLMALPKKLKAKYDRILLPLVALRQGGAAVAGANMRKGGRDGGREGRGGGGGGDGSIQLDTVQAESIKAYGKINRLLQGFLDHSIPDIDYTVTNRRLLEEIMDIEFKDPSEHGYFYKDNGHSFDSILFYGSTVTLIIFEVLFFGLVDLGTKNYLFDGAMLYLLMEVFVKGIRNAMGKSNLAKMTMVDERFLI